MNRKHLSRILFIQKITSILPSPYGRFSIIWVFACASGGEPAFDRLHAMNYAVVSPQGPRDGGDFGPNTPGTKTSGLQEAFDFAKANRKDVYIAGGTMPEKFKDGVVYHLQTTLRIPWFQDFHLDGGEYVINYDASKGDAIVIDSQMSCNMKFGLIVAPTDGAVVRMKPETKGPDGFAVITTSVFRFNAVVGGGSVFEDGKKAPTGTGLLLDSSNGPIVYNTINAGEVIACRGGIVLDCGGKGDAIADNNIDSIFMHLCAEHLRVGAPGCEVTRNQFRANIDGNSVDGASGVRIFGTRNLFTLDIGRCAKGKAIVVEAPAQHNLLTMLSSPIDYTNNAELPTNKITATAPAGFSIETPPVSAPGAPTVNQTPFAVEAMIINPGKVSEWKLTDHAGASQAFDAPLKAGQSIALEPGEAITMRYDQAPTWRWRAR